MNSGLEVAEGKYVCFLNSDTVATPQWLSEMVDVLQDESIGLVTPVYTESTGQLSAAVNPELPDVDIVEEPLSLKGVCFMLPMKVLQEVGSWDAETFKEGGGEDNDLCYRVAQAGYRLAVARRAYIFHYGSASYRELREHDVEASKKVAASQFRKFQQKHDLQGGLGPDKPSVFIAIPSVSGLVNAELAMRLVQWSHDPAIQIGIKFYTHLSPLDHARNVAVKEYLEAYWDRLCFIDDDIVPPPNCLRELLVADKDIIAPLCFTMKPGEDGIHFPMPVAHRYDENHEYRPYYGKGIEETDVITGGMHLVKREVYEQLDRPYYFTYHANGTVIYSEDFVFSQQCQELGYKLYTHYGLHCKHIRYVDIKGVNDLMAKYARSG